MLGDTYVITLELTEEEASEYSSTLYYAYPALSDEGLSKWFQALNDATVFSSQTHQQIIDESWPTPGHCSDCWMDADDDYVGWGIAEHFNHQGFMSPPGADSA